ncbi:hypothetical protein N7492_002265 [Penicillium capsulatum]|uniref:Uncharacterized protein n=1 Tax=Penicillium capsulatum TaxID=69766 RepID=A0A9W9IL65_9EURO|nr:hypothetical protein N7492_002265 [Penicillium capsulatum]KAJ6123131.1 hypothetical protein N7512_005596 [Penicillium capsulatum]
MSPVTATTTAELHASKALRFFRSIGLPILTVGAVVAIRHAEIVGQSIEHEFVAPTHGHDVALGVQVDDAVALDAVPELVVASRLVNDFLVLGLADCEILLDEPVPAHHHMDRSAEAAQEIGSFNVAGRSRHGHVEGPEYFTGFVEGFDALVVRHVGEGVVGFTLGAMLEVRHGIVHGIANLAHDIVLFIGEADVEKVVAGEGRGDGEASEGVAVAHTEPLLGGTHQRIDIAAKQLTVMSATAGLVRGDQEEGLVLAGHILMRGRSLEDAREDGIEVVAEDFRAGGDVHHGTTELGNDADDDRAHEGDIPLPVGVLRDHGPGIFPGTSQDLALDLGGQIDPVQVMSNVIGVIPLVLDRHDFFLQ